VPSTLLDPGNLRRAFLRGVLIALLVGGVGFALGRMSDEVGISWGFLRVCSPLLGGVAVATALLEFHALEAKRGWVWLSAIGVLALLANLSLYLHEPYWRALTLYGMGPALNTVWGEVCELFLVRFPRGRWSWASNQAWEHAIDAVFVTHVAAAFLLASVLRVGKRADAPALVLLPFLLAPGAFAFLRLSDSIDPKYLLDYLPFGSTLLLATTALFLIVYWVAGTPEGSISACPSVEEPSSADPPSRPQA
jgi:hypothetical protein